MIVADAFDAMTTNRIYKPRMSIEDALVEITKQSGHQFHPKVVEVATKVLMYIDISNTTQMPSSELEQRRMAYFFQDPLTGLYNEDYLQILLNGNDHKYKYLNILDIHNFSAYNQKHGWKEGNNLLKNIACLLEELYGNKESAIVRYHGDDFIILSALHVRIEVDSLSQHELFTSSNIGVDVRNYDVDNYFTYDVFLEKENR